MFGLKKSKIRVLLGCRRPGQTMEPGATLPTPDGISQEEFLKICQQLQNFDQSVATTAAAIPVPEGSLPGLLSQLQQSNTTSSPISAFWRQPAFWAVLLSVLILAGFGIFSLIQKSNSFPGVENVERILSQLDSLDGSEFEEVETKAASLSDWFFLNSSLENFDVPKEFGEYQTIGSRVTQLDGHPVAQIVIGGNGLLFMIFRTDDFKISLPQNQQWTYVKSGEWIAALRQNGNQCFLVTFKGTYEEMQAFLESPHPNPQF